MPPLPRALLLATALASLSFATEAPSSSTPAPLQPSAFSLQPSALSAHPRLFATPSAWQALEARRQQDPVLGKFCQALITDASKFLKKEPLTRKMTGKRLLHVSRDLILRTQFCSFAWKLTGDRRFLDKAREDLLAVAAFPDWNPSHFLDVAEMSAGVALGYDWLYADLTPADRATLREALVTKGLNLVRNGHSTFKNTNNWSQVCIGGLSLAALALADEEPELAASVLKHARANLSKGLHAYAPEGVYPEGPGYWSYGTTFSVLLDAAVKDALHEDWGLLAAPGFLPSARFFAHVTAPSGKFFNFADCGAKATLSPPLWYLARQLQRPELVQAQKDFLAAGKGGAENDRFAPLVALWWPAAPVETAPAPEPTFFTGQGENPVALWRSSWTDPRPTYFAIKGGGAGVSHGHMDGGSFVLEWQGSRWAEDLGMQDYESLESKGVKLWGRQQDSDRWKIFRIGPFSHNTLTIDGQLHRADGLAKLLRATPLGAELDLTPLFLPGQAGKVTRSIRLTPDRLTITDHGTGCKPGSLIRFALSTRATPKFPKAQAKASASGETTATATLVLEGKPLPLSFKATSPELTLRAQDISQPVTPVDAPNPGLTQLQAELKTAPDGTWSLETTFDLSIK